MADEVTPLPPGQEAAFEQWLQRNHVNDLDHPGSHYDYRGAFLAGVGRAPGTEGHFTDRFKQHGHPTFSEESQYSKGPGDGGSWDGERFIPGKPVTPGFLPGQPPIGYGMTPGVHHNVTTGRDDMTGDPEPVEPQAPPLLPGGPAPDRVDLEESAPGKAPPPLAPEPTGWRIKNKDGSVLAEFHNVNTQDYQKKKIQQVGDALLSQAVTPDDKEAAQRATAYGLSLVGIMPADQITKRMDLMYQADERNLLSRAIQAEKSKRASMRGGGPSGMVPGGPTKAEHKLSEDAMNRVDHIVQSYQQNDAYKKLAEAEQTQDQLEYLMNSGNSLSERIGVQTQLLALTGKASRESEQAAVTGGAGMWDALGNKMKMWVSDNPELSEAYRKQFRSMIATQRQYIARAKEKIARAAAAAAQAELGGYGAEQSQAGADIAYGRITGHFSSDYKPPHERSAAPAPTVAGTKPAPAKASVPDLDF